MAEHRSPTADSRWPSAKRRKPTVDRQHALTEIRRPIATAPRNPTAIRRLPSAGRCSGGKTAAATLTASTSA
jgi:dienelactone hydrolase